MNRFCSSLAFFAAFFLAVGVNSQAAISIGNASLPAGATTPITVSISTVASIGSISVVTRGITGLDFTDAGGGTCSVGATYSAGSTCTVMVHFAPTYPGPRYGAILLKDSTSNANVFATVYLQGTSQAPQISLVDPPIVNLGPVNIYAYSYDLDVEPSYGELTFDPAGNIYIASPANGITKWIAQPGGSFTITSLPTLPDDPTRPVGPSIVIDGAGNLYVACVTSICKETLTQSGDYSLSTVASGFKNIFGLAIDGAGNLYVSDVPQNGSSPLQKLTIQPDGSYLSSSISTASTFAGPVAVDFAGDIFLSDDGGHGGGVKSLFKETPSGSNYTESTVNDSRLYDPGSIALDWNGAVYVTDSGDFANAYDYRKCRVDIYGSPALVKETLQLDGSYLASRDQRSYTSPAAVSFDDAGNRYVVDTSAACYTVSGALFKTESDTSTPPSIAFGSSLRGVATATKSVAYTNNGNAPLNFSAITFPTHFPRAAAAAGDCVVGTPLAPGANCNVSFFFKSNDPANGVPSKSFNETITVSSNTFKRNPQTIQVSGTELMNQNAAPVFSLAAGTYPSAQTLTITEATAGASVYYTTDGSTPSSSSAKYTGPINVGSTETVAAIAILAGNIDSSVTSAHYLIQQPAATPVFSIAAGTYNNQQNATITDASPGVVIYYTLNETTPTTASNKYTGPVAIRSTETLKANAVGLPNYYTGPTASAAYTLAVAAPVLTPAAGTYSGPRTITITDATTVAHIYYTTNGSTPTGYSTPYTGPITVSASETIKVIAISTGYTASPVTTAAYTILGPPAIPTFSVPTGTYNNQQNVAITDSVPGATFYYTLNGTTPTTASTRYTAPVAVRNTSTLRAIAVASGYPPSAVGSATYTLLAATPVLTPAGGTYTGARTVTITDASATAHLYYTTNGSNPTGYSTPYTGPITVSASETIKAIAIATGYTPSPVVTNTYIIH